MTDIVFFTDTSRPGIWLRGIGPYSLASTLRHEGFSVEVIDFISAYGYNDFCSLCDRYLDKDTKLVGISTTWISSPGKITTDLKTIEVKVAANHKQKLRRG